MLLSTLHREVRHDRYPEHSASPMVTPMLGKKVLAGLAILLLCGCSAPFGPSCADEFIEGSVSFPDGTQSGVCAEAQTGGFRIIFLDARTCAVASATATAATVDGSWVVSGAGEWFASTGRKTLEVSYSPSGSLHPSLCPAGTAYCSYRQSCRFDISKCATASGEVVEATIAEPCVLQDPWGMTMTMWSPTVDSMRFRAHISTSPVSDAGAVCGYP